jgi:hypothetical protein
VDLLGGRPSTIEPSSVDSLENRQYDGSGVHQEGGSLQNLDLLKEAERILILAHQRQLGIHPEFFPSEENLQADTTFCFQDIPDWHLHPTLFSMIASMWGLSVIDLFASQASTQTKRLFSWDEMDNPEAVDALSQRWDFKLASLSPHSASLESL